VHGYLLDTNIVAYWFDERRSEHQRVVQHIQELPDATPLMISAITLGEIEYGLQVARGDVPNELIADSDSSPICKSIDE
jgi:predicted nucleic acid-binding protein